MSDFCSISTAVSLMRSRSGCHGEIPFSLLQWVLTCFSILKTMSSTRFASEQQAYRAMQLTATSLRCTLRVTAAESVRCDSCAPGSRQLLMRSRSPLSHRYTARLCRLPVGSPAAVFLCLVRP